MGYADIITKALEIHQLPDPTRTEADKSLEQRQILDGDELSNVTLHVSFQIITKGLGRVDSGVINSRIETGQQ